MPNTKSAGVAFNDPALVAGTTIDGAVITNSTVGITNTITAGAFNGTVGATTPSTGAFTTVTASTSFDGPVGAVTPAAVTATALIATSVANSGAMVNSSVQALAAAGTDQTNAGAILTTARTVVVSAANGTKGVILPASVVGKEIQIKNNAAAVLKIYPPASSAINALTATTGSLDIASLTTVTLVCTGATQWFSFPLLPS